MAYYKNNPNNGYQPSIRGEPNSVPPSTGSPVIKPISENRKETIIMERKITITASNGEVFTGTNFQELEREVNNYELELSKKKQEAAERQRKAEEEYKARIDKVRAEVKRKEETKNTLKKEIDDLATKLTEKVNEYSKVTNEEYSYANVNGELKVVEKTSYKIAKAIGLPWFSF